MKMYETHQILDHVLSENYSPEIARFLFLFFKEMKYDRKFATFLS